MDMFEEARALQGTLRMCGMSQGQIAKKLGVSQSYIANKLRLLKFSSRMQERIKEYGLCERQARALLRLRDERLQSCALTQMEGRHLTVAESEALVESLMEKEEIRAPKPPELDRGFASCLSLLRLYGTVTEHRVTEAEGEVTFLVRMLR